MSFWMRLIRFLAALVGYTSVHWASGRWARALVWDALLLVSVIFIIHIPLWVVGLVALAQAVDAAVIEPSSARGLLGLFLAMLLAVCGSVVVALVVRAAWVESFRVPSGAMIPTVQVGDHLFVDKSAKHPRRGEVAVFKYPTDPSKDFIKRVVAVGGDTVEIRDNALILNGTPVPRVHVDGACTYEDRVEETGRWETRACDAFEETLDGHSYRVILEPLAEARPFGPAKVPDGSYFVLGDNRDNSFDSRMWGVVPQDHIKGIARTIWQSDGPNGPRRERAGMTVR